MKRICNTILLLLLYSLSKAEVRPFYTAWALDYQFSKIRINNGFVRYSNPSGNFYGTTYETGRANALFSAHNIGFNIESLSKRFYIQARTSFPLGWVKVKDSADFRGRNTEFVSLKFAAGPSFGPLGIQVGLYGQWIRKEMSGPLSSGYFYGTTGFNFGTRYFDQLNTWDGGIMLQAVYQVNDHMGFRASYSAGAFRNKTRNIKGKSRETELKFYYTFEDSHNKGFYIAYRNSAYFADGINEEVNSNGNSGSMRFPASYWKQGALVLGVNIPIVFN